MKQLGSFFSVVLSFDVVALDVDNANHRSTEMCTDERLFLLMAHERLSWF